MCAAPRGADLEKTVGRLTFFLPWAAVAAALALLSTAALSLAGSSPPQTEPLPTIEEEIVLLEEPLVVPDVRRQPYVFAKGILDDAGFSWRVKGKVEAYPANTVAKQSPAPGTLVVDTGAPRIVLTLKRNKDYEQRGLPQPNSPFKGTKIVLWEDAGAVPEAPIEAPSEPDPAAPSTPPASTSEAETEAETETAERQPAFIVPGAPPEPVEEITLIARAERLEALLAGAARTPELEKAWLYQHEWIVTGAEFGWFSGEEALVLLIEIDEDLQARWGIGAKSAEVARESLAEVRRKTAEANQ